MDSIYDDCIIRYKEVFTREECNSIIDYISFFEQHRMLFHDESRLHLENHKTINLAYDYELHLPTASTVLGLVLPKFKDCVDSYLKKYSVLSCKKFLVHDCKLKKISAGGGFHSWHFESGTISTTQRIFVIQLYLNDDFDGGETEFLYQNKREKPSAGDVLMFPTSYTHTHRGNPPIGGTKYLVTSWGWLQYDDGQY